MRRNTRFVASAGRFQSEHGLSVLVETASAKILMDTGPRLQQFACGQQLLRT